jgi:tRNA threonylcarbamoyladenosine biosynthesis protein TsaB
LTIDTSDSHNAVVGLRIGKKKITKSAKRRLSSQIVLLLIDKILKENKIEINQIEEVKVFLGPGSFTGLRVGIAVGNSIASSLGIKINGAKQIVDAKYK